MKKPRSQRGPDQELLRICLGCKHFKHLGRGILQCTRTRGKCPRPRARRLIKEAQ